MHQASCTLCGRTFPRRNNAPVTAAGWYADGWVYFPDSGRPKLQPYCPTCKPAAEVCHAANASRAGGPWLTYSPEAGGSVRVARFQRNADAGPSASTFRKVDSVVTTPEAVRLALAIPEGPGHIEAVWSVLKS